MQLLRKVNSQFTYIVHLEKTTKLCVIWVKKIAQTINNNMLFSLLYIKAYIILVSQS